MPLDCLELAMVASFALSGTLLKKMFTVKGAVQSEIKKYQITYFFASLGRKKGFGWRVIGLAFLSRYNSSRQFRFNKIKIKQAMVGNFRFWSNKTWFLKQLIARKEYKLCCIQVYNLNLFASFLCLVPTYIKFFSVLHRTSHVGIDSTWPGTPPHTHRKFLRSRWPE